MPRLAITPQLLQAAARVAVRTTPSTPSTRLFSSLPTLRPTLAPRPSIFRSPNTSATSPTSLFTPAAGAGTDSAVADLVPKTTAITAHPAVGQIRCGPRATMARTSRLKRQRKFGFLARIRSKGGRKVLARRREKGRRRLCA